MAAALRERLGAVLVAIPGPPGESLRNAAALLRDVVPDAMETMRMGGGTVLAARWNHRRSTDVDLACD